jgi:tRNA 2-thiocytidine biosynthesis protein TtcA
MLQRKQIGEMLRLWQRQHPGRIESILRALTDVAPSHLLDRKLFDFFSLESESEFEQIGEPLFAE